MGAGGSPPRGGRGNATQPHHSREKNTRSDRQKKKKQQQLIHIPGVADEVNHKALRFRAAHAKLVAEGGDVDRGVDGAVDFEDEGAGVGGKVGLAGHKEEVVLQNPRALLQVLVRRVKVEPNVQALDKLPPKTSQEKKKKLIIHRRSE